MRDGYGREINYLRVSLTDKCNLRCKYCMPEAGVDPLRHEDILTYEEIERIVGIMAGLGVKKVRLTGGEPMVRKDAAVLVRKLRAVSGIREIAMTTNGVLLSANARRLKEAGLDSVNVSLDTLSPETFADMTGRDALSDVKSGIRAALLEGLSCKINVVPVEGRNIGELSEIARIAQKEPVDVRFIELMPLGCGKLFRGMPADKVLCLLENCFGKAEKLTGGDVTVGGPAVYYAFPGFTGRIGLISPLSRPFCDTCNRLRLTADGFLKLCLQSAEGINVKEYLRNGAADAELASMIEKAVSGKPAAHHFLQQETAAGEEEHISGEEMRKMVQIGG